MFLKKSVNRKNDIKNENQEFSGTINDNYMLESKVNKSSSLFAAHLALMVYKLELLPFAI